MPDAMNVLIVLAVLVPVLSAFFARTLAGFIAQDHWPDYINEGIADGFILIAVASDVYVMARASADFALFTIVPSGLLTAYLAQSLGTLKRWSLFLQSNFLVIHGDHVELDNPTTGEPLFVMPTQQPIILPGDTTQVATSGSTQNVVVPPPITLPLRRTDTPTDGGK